MVNDHLCTHRLHVLDAILVIVVNGHVVDFLVGKSATAGLLYLLENVVTTLVKVLVLLGVSLGEKLIFGGSFVEVCLDGCLEGIGNLLASCRSWLLLFLLLLGLILCCHINIALCG